MTNGQLKSILSSYGAEQLHPVAPGEYAYIAGRGIRFHNYLKGTSRIFWPSVWTDDQERPNFIHQNRSSDGSIIDSHSEGGFNSLFHDSVKTTRELFRSGKSTSTPNTSVTSHDRGTDIRAVDSLVVDNEGSVASSGQMTQQSGKTQRGAQNQNVRKAHTYNPFQKSGNKLNPASINVMATCVSQKIFAYGEKRLNPAIHIHDSSTFQHIATFMNATTLEFTYLNFSRDGKFLVALGSIPDFSVTIWNVETGEIVGSSTTSSQTLSITFDPRDSTQLCSSGSNGHLVFWTLSAGSLRAQEPMLTTTDLIDPTHFLCHTWGRNSDLFIGAQNGDILYFSSIHAVGDLMSTDQIEGTESIRSITISKYHLITGSEDGVIRFYTLDTKEFCKQILASTGQSQFNDLSFGDEDEFEEEPWKLKQNSISTSDINSLILNPPYDTLVVGSSNGSLYEITLNEFSDRNTIISDIKMQSISISSKLVNDSHCGSVNGISILKNASKLITAGEDGSIRFWNYRRGTLESKILFNANLTALAVWNQLLIVGSSKGFLRVVDMGSLLDGNENPKVLFSVRLRIASIDQLEIDSKGNCLVRFNDNYVGVLMINDSNQSQGEYALSSLVQESFNYSLYLAGFLKFEFPVSCIHFLNDSTAYIATEDCTLLQIKIPKRNNFASAPDYILSLEQLTHKKWKLDYPALNVHQLHESKSEVLIFSLDKSLKIYDLSNSSTLTVVSPVHEIESHLKSDRAILALSADGKSFASGADDGLIWIRNFKNGFDSDKILNREGCYFLYSNNSIEGGVRNLCFGAEGDNHLVFGAGGDGTVLVIDTSITATNNFETVRTVIPLTEQSTPTVFLASELYGIDNDKQKLITELSTDKSSSRFLSSEAREKAELRLKELQNEFNQIRLENENAPEDERITESEFIFDLEYVSSIEKIQEKDVLEYKEQLKNENFKNELLTQRIIDECVKSIDKHSETITGLLDVNLHVNNYVMPFIDEKKSKLLDKIKFMRRVEETDLISRRKNALVRNLEGGIPGEDNNNDDSKHNFETEEEEISEETHNFHKYVMPEYDIRNRSRVEIPSGDSNIIQYSKFDLYTRQRKTTQMWLLHGEIRNIKLKFNNEFKELQTVKENVLNKVERVNSLIVDIVNELEYNPEDYIFKYTRKEEDFLTVKDNEVKAEKWIDPKELARIQEEERRKRAALENSKEVEIIERALQMMMDGRLEDKSKKKSAAEEIPKPSFYNKPSDELTDSEKKAILEYEKAIKEFEEEETKKRKQLEAKLKNAQNEIFDACTNFDQKLKEVFRNKLQSNHTIFETELAIIKLSQSVLDQEDNLSQQGEQKRIEMQLEQQNTEFVQTVQQFDKTLNEYTRQCDEMSHTITDLERNFKENIILYIKQYQQQHSTDYSTKDIQDVADRLSKLYPRSKALKLKFPSRQEFIQRTQTDPDPYVDVTAEKEWIPPAINQSVKRPDNISDWLWKRFLEVRKEKIQLEFDYLVKTQDLEKRRLEGQQLREYTKHLEEVISQQIKDRNKFNEKILREQYNLDYLFTLKQGQIEVEQQAVVTDYGDAILISKQNILDLNRLIINQATQNIEQMRNIMDQSKKISQIAWENEALHFETEEKEDIYLRFQRLRVTKEMQSFLKTGQSSQERDRERLVDQIQHTKEIREVRIKEKKKAAIKIRKNMERTSSENSTLQSQLNQMQRLVQEREEIYQLQSSTAAKEKTNQKMKQLRMERKLQDLSKAQSEELNQLKQTIQLLRERTFPSFALVQKRPGV